MQYSPKPDNGRCSESCPYLGEVKKKGKPTGEKVCSITWDDYVPGMRCKPDQRRQKGSHG